MAVDNSRNSSRKIPSVTVYGGWGRTATTAQERIAALSQFSSDDLLTEWLRRQGNDRQELLLQPLVADLPLPQNGQQT